MGRERHDHDHERHESHARHERHERARATSAKSTQSPTLVDWTEEAARDFGRRNQRLHHHLESSPLFSDDGIAALFDRYPRDRLEVNTTGWDPSASFEWYMGRPGALDGHGLLEAVRAGRLWLNLRRVNHADPAMRALCDRILAEVFAHTGQRTLKADLGLLISSPGAHVVYHLDIPMVMLWQIRGEKRVWVYPVEETFFSDAWIEGIVLRESDEHLPYRPGFDERAFVHDLVPGELLSWPQNAPHRIVNGDVVNVSLSIEYMTPPALWRANVLYANGLLRRRLGLSPSRVRSPRALEPLKVALARRATLAQGREHNRTPVKRCFTLDARQPGRIVYDEGVKPFEPPARAAAR